MECIVLLHPCHETGEANFLLSVTWQMNVERKRQSVLEVTVKKCEKQGNCVWEDSEYSVYWIKKHSM